MKINGLELPQLLLRLESEGNWKLPSVDREPTWRRVFDSGLFLNRGMKSVGVFHISDMELATGLLEDKRIRSKWGSNFPKLKQRIYTQDYKLSPVSIFQDHLIVIGDLLAGRFPDFLVCPICLYYPNINSAPRVIYLPDDYMEDYWVEIAPDFESFVKWLKIGE
jgi:hypothetical protein